MNIKKFSTIMVVTALLASVFSLAMLWNDTDDNASAENTYGVMLNSDASFNLLINDTILDGISDKDLLEVYLELINNAHEIFISVNDEGNIVVDISGVTIMPMGGSTGVSTWYDGIIVHLDSGACDMILSAGAGAAGSVIIFLVGAALGSVVPIFGTAIGGAAMALIGGAVFGALTSYLTNGVDFGNGVNVTVKLIGHAYGIPYPYPPTVVSIIPQ